MDSTPISLLKRASSGNDPEAWGKLVDLLLPKMLDWSKRFNLNPCDRDDIIQDLFIYLLQKLPEFQYDPKKTFLGWLRTLLNHRIIDLFRGRRFHGSIDGYAPEETDLPQLEEEEFQAWIYERALELSRSQFSEKTWKAFWLHAIQGIPAAEVASELELKISSVYVAKQRVQTYLRNEFAEFFP